MTVARPRVFRKSSCESMPDGTTYSPLLPDPLDADGRFGAGLINVPPGALTWAHNHWEPECFVVLEGEAHLQWDGGDEHLQAGDAVLLPPLVRHAFASVNAGATLRLFHCHGPDPDDAARHAEARAAELASEHPPALILAPEEGDEVLLASVAERWLEQRGISVQRRTFGSAALGERLAEYVRLEMTPGGPALDLEPHRGLLIRAIDRASINTPLRRVLALALADRLPIVTGENLRRALSAAARCSVDIGRALLLFFPRKEAVPLGLALPVLLQCMRATPPAVLHMADTEAVDLDSISSGLRTACMPWYAGVLARTAEHHGSRVPSAGRWSPELLVAWDELRGLALSAARALSPQVLDLKRGAALLRSILNRAGELGALHLLVEPCESFEAEGRTALALELATVLQFAALVHPLHPLLSSTLLRPFDGFVPRPGTLELPPAGLVLGGSRS